MQNFLKFLYQNNVLKIGPDKITKWTKNKSFELLILTIEIETYDLKILAINGLKDSGYQGSMLLLIDSVDDLVQPVSEAAMEALTLLNPYDLKIEMLVKNKMNYWKYKQDDSVRSKNSYSSDITFLQTPNESASKRLNRQLRDQQGGFHPPFGF